MFNTTSGAGTGTAGLIIGGFIDPSPNAMTNCEEYNGSSWTNTGSLNVATGFATAFGTQTNAVTQVNSPNYEGSEQYNGSTWAALPNIGVTSPGGLYGSSAGATGDAGWISSMSPTLNKTAEWNFTANTITPGAWSAGGVLGTARYYQGSATSAPSTAALVYGGSLTGTGNSAKTEAYNGTSWSEQNDLNTARTRIAGFGTQTAAVAVAGRIMGGTDSVTNVEEYNGSWTNVTAYPFANRGSSGSGTLTAGLVSGGQIPPYSATCKEYDGTNWTTAGSLNTARGYAAGIFGTQTATGFAGGTYPRKSNYEEYNGSSWSEISTLVTASGQGFGFGTIESATIGNVPSVGSQQWNGSSWSTAPSMATVRDAYAGGGISGSSGLATGGYISTLRNETEEFTGETTAVNVKTLTSS